MDKIRVGVVRRINDKKFEDSNYFLNFINEEFKNTHKVVDIFIDQENNWHILGLPVLPADLYHKIDVVWNSYDTHIGQTLSSLGVPHVSMNPFQYLISQNKNYLNDYAKSHNVNMLQNILIPPYQEDIDGDIEKFAFKKAKEVWNKFSPPFTIYTKNEDKDTGIFVIKTFPELVKHILEFSEKKENILIEEIILGEKYSFYFIPGFRKEEYYFLNPNKITDKIKKEVLEISHKFLYSLDTKHYIKISFLLKKDKVLLDNIDFSLDLNDPLFIKAITDLGIKKTDIVEHILKNATI